jgi:hypothetical protein
VISQIDSGEFTHQAIDEESTLVDVDGDHAVVASRALYTAVLGGHHGRYRLHSALHYHRRGSTWRAVSGTSTLA